MFAVQQRVLGPAHPQTLLSMSNLARTILVQNRFDEAIKINRQAWEIAKNARGTEDEVTRRQKKQLEAALTNHSWKLATASSHEEGDSLQAIQLAQESIELYPSSANNRDNLGVALYRNGQWNEAVEALTKARKMRSGKDPAHQFFLAMALGKLEKNKRRLSTTSRPLNGWRRKGEWKINVAFAKRHRVSSA